MKWGTHKASTLEMRSLQKILGGDSQETTPRWRTRRRWEDNIKMDLKGDRLN